MADINLVAGDFCPLNTWVEMDNGVVDLSTGREYLLQSRSNLRGKCLLLSFGTPFVQTPFLLLSTAIRVSRVLTGFHFWSGCGHRPYQFQIRLQNAAKDLLLVATVPIALLGLELAALYGILRPYDGRKLYATLERAQYAELAISISPIVDGLACAFLGLRSFSFAEIRERFSMTIKDEWHAIYGIYADSQEDQRRTLQSHFGFDWSTGFVLAPCFQPDAQRHLFDGDLADPNAY